MSPPEGISKVAPASRHFVREWRPSIRRRDLFALRGRGGVEARPSGVEIANFREPFAVEERVERGLEHSEAVAARMAAKFLT